MAENQSNSSTGMSSNVTHKRRCPWEAENLNNPAKIHDSSSEHRRRGNANELNVTSSKPCIHLYKDKIDEFHINNLPENLLLCIFKKLPLYDLLHRMSLVCQYWNKLSKDQDLWRNIDLRTHMKVNDVILLKLLSYSDNVTSLNITDVRLVTTIGFQASLNQCTRLKCLVANRCQQLTEPAFSSIGLHCRMLTKLCLDSCYAVTDASLEKICSRCTKLQDLHLSQCMKITSKGVSHIATSCPNLRTLILNQCQKVKDNCMEDLIKGCPLLEQLSCMSCDLSESGLIHIAKLKHLKILDLSCISKLTRDPVMRIVQHCPLLTDLNISLCSTIDDVFMEHVAKYAKSLNRLIVVSCSITDKGLTALAQHSRTVEHLDVGWCSGISDKGVKYIARESKTLRYLGLMRCDSVQHSSMEQLVIEHPLIHFSTMILDTQRLLSRARREGIQFDDTSS